MSSLPLPFPPAGTAFTIENLRKYSMLRPQYEYNGKPFPCSRPEQSIVSKDWLGQWNGPMCFENFYDDDPRHDCPTDDEDEHDFYDYSDLEAEEAARYYYDSEDDCYEPLSVRESLHRHMPASRRMGWLSRAALAGISCNFR